MTLQMMRDEAEQAVWSRIERLALLGHDLAERPSATELAAEFQRLHDVLGDREIERLVDLPMMDNSDMATAMSVMVELGIAADLSDAALHQMICLRLVQLTLAHGLSQSSVYGCAGLGQSLGPAFDRHVDAERFARAGVAIAERGGYPASDAYVALQKSILWTRPAVEAVALLNQAVELGKAAGAELTAWHAAEQQLTTALFCGESLDAVWARSGGDSSFAEGCNDSHVRDIVASTRGFVQALRGGTSEEAVGDEEIEARIRAGGLPVVSCLHGILQMQRLFLLGDPAGALAAAEALAPVLWAARCHIQFVNYRVFHSLAIAACHRQGEQARRKVLDDHASELGRWASRCPSSFAHKHALVTAEIARLDGHDTAAFQLYERAIQGATDNGFVQDRALASELAAAFYQSLGLVTASRAYWHDARRAYIHWGARRKVALLDRDRRCFEIGEATTSAESSPIGTSQEQVDFSAVAREAQKLSGHLAQAELIDRLMVISTEHAAAQRSLLVLREADAFLLEAIAYSKSDGIAVERVHRALTPADMPESILRHVLHTRVSVTLDDARQANVFSHDGYLRQGGPRSILGLPLIDRDQLIGILYFESALAPHVFTPVRYAKLDLLASQAAISLQNARRVATLEREIAEHRQSTAALRHSEERYALAVEAATDGHADWIAESDEYYCSPRWREQWGLPADVAVFSRQQMANIFPWHPDDRERVQALVKQAYESDTKRLELDARVIVRGEVRWIHGTTLYVRGPSGKLLRTSTVTTDITARRRAEEELRASEERYALALAGSEESIFDWDIKTGLIYIAPRTQELLGIPVGEVWRQQLEWRALMRHHPEDEVRRRQAMNDHVEGKTPMYDIEVRVLLPSGVRWLHQRGRALRDSEGRAYRLAGSVSDITDRKRSQEDMLRLESRLRQAERFEAMGTLAGGIAHDFNNILAAILGFGERAQRSAETGSPLHHDITNVIVAGKRGRTLVDSILSFSRGTGERVPVDVEKVVREALELLQAKLPPRITLRTHLRAGRAALQGDATQIHQLLMNLGTNAEHAMLGDGELAVSLEATVVTRQHQATVGLVTPGEWIVLEVADKGTGISADVLPRIFDPFFTTKDANVGTGLGLSLVLRILTELGGAIDVRSEVCVGSTFTVYLPRAGDAPEDIQDSLLSAPVGQGQRVLVVDDEEPLLELATDALRELGYRPVGFSSAVAALRAFRAQPDAFDALITDHRMPGISGERLIGEVRRIRPLLPIILVSGYVGDSAVLHPESGSADEILVKPLRENALATSLGRLLGAA